MLHERDYGEAEPTEVVGLASVASTVASNLLPPPLAIPLGFDVAARAAVPEASVHEDGDPMVGEHEVGLAGEVSGLRRVPDAQLSRDSPHASFGFCIFRGDATHPLRHRSGRLERL